MLKPGILFVGPPSIYLHEALSIALFLQAPLALTDQTSYLICKKFSSICPVFLIDENFTPGFFISGISKLFTNLTSHEVYAFVENRMLIKNFKLFHLLDDVTQHEPSDNNGVFCSSFPHHQISVPLGQNWINLGPIGYLSYLKNKKELNRIFSYIFRLKENAFFSMAHILDNPSSIISDESTLDEIQFMNLVSSNIDLSLNRCIPLHGLLDTALETASAGIIHDERLSTLALFHHKPIIGIDIHFSFYQKLHPLIAKMPENPKYLKALIEHYFDFETLDRKALIEREKVYFYKKCFFQ